MKYECVGCGEIWISDGYLVGGTCLKCGDCLVGEDYSPEESLEEKRADDEGRNEN